MKINSRVKSFLSLKSKKSINRRNSLLIAITVVSIIIALLLIFRPRNKEINSKSTQAKQPVVTQFNEIKDNSTTVGVTTTEVKSTVTKTTRETKETLTDLKVVNFFNFIDFKIENKTYYRYLADKFPEFAPSSADIKEFSAIAGNNVYEDVKAVFKKISKIKFPNNETVSDQTIGKIIPLYIKAKLKIDKYILKIPSLINKSASLKNMDKEANRIFSHFCFRLYFSYRYWNRFFKAKLQFREITDSLNSYTGIEKLNIIDREHVVVEFFKQILEDNYRRIFGFIKDKLSVTLLINAYSDSMWPILHDMHVRQELIMFGETIYYLLLLFDTKRDEESKEAVFRLKPAFVQFKENEIELQIIKVNFERIYNVVSSLNDKDKYLQGENRVNVFTKLVRGYFNEINDVLENKLNIEAKIKAV